MLISREQLLDKVYAALITGACFSNNGRWVSTLLQVVYDGRETSGSDIDKHVHVCTTERNCVFSGSAEG